MPNDINFNLFWQIFVPNKILNLLPGEHGMVKKTISRYCPFKKQDIQLFIGWKQSWCLRDIFLVGAFPLFLFSLIAKQTSRFNCLFTTLLSSLLACHWSHIQRCLLSSTSSPSNDNIRSADLIFDWPKTFSSHWLRPHRLWLVDECVLMMISPQLKWSAEFRQNIAVSLCTARKKCQIS